MPFPAWIHLTFSSHSITNLLCCYYCQIQIYKSMLALTEIFNNVSCFLWKMQAIDMASNDHNTSICLFLYQHHCKGMLYMRQNFSAHQISHFVLQLNFISTLLTTIEVIVIAVIKDIDTMLYLVLQNQLCFWHLI